MGWRSVHWRRQRSTCCCGYVLIADWIPRCLALPCASASKPCRLLQSSSWRHKVCPGSGYCSCLSIWRLLVAWSACCEKWVWQAWLCHRWNSATGVWNSRSRQHSSAMIHTSFLVSSHQCRYRKGGFVRVLWGWGRELTITCSCPVVEVHVSPSRRWGTNLRVVTNRRLRLD